MLKYLLKLKEQTRKVPPFLCQASMKAMLLKWSLWKNMDFEELGECLPKMYSHITCQFCASKTVKLNVIKQLYPPFHRPSNSSVESETKCQVQEVSNSSLDLLQVLQISICTHPYIICYLEQQEWESFARKCQVESATWVRVGVFNGCDMCKMHKNV